jgi:signal transduction histidine kinase
MAQKFQSGNVGLGLAIGKHILELHNKCIRVGSTPECEATFAFDLPIYQPA